ncbi:MAG: DUF2341 domain-containing protein, partial [Promethearchaeota archaeon]
MVSGTGSHENFPVLISIYDSDLHDDVQSNGYDIAFANDEDMLDHEIELFDQTYNSTHAHLIAWVRIPSLSTSIDTVIYMYYGNPTMSSQENPSGVWIDYVGVSHFAESSGDAKDSSVYNVDGSTTIIDYQETGQIGHCFNWTDGESSQVNYGDPIDGHLDFGTGNMTVSLWVNIDQDVDNFQWIVAKGRNFAGDPGFFINSDFTPTSLWRFGLGDSTTTNYNVASDPIVDFDEWNYVVGTVDRWADFSYIYTNNGSYDNRINISGLGSISTTKNLILPFNPSSFGFDGLIDEFRLTDMYRSEGWINSEYNNQNDPSTFYSIGKEYHVSDHPSNAHFFTYFKEIIIDHTMVSGSEDLLNFPVLISNFDEDLRDKVQMDGDDIAFSDGMSWLDHEIELFDQTYNDTHARFVAWVRIPSLSGGSDTTIRMYYSNSTMASRQNPTGVWDKYFKGVWHLSESTGNAQDSTSYGISGNLSAGVTQDVSGQIYSGYDFDGIDSNVDFGDPIDGHLDFGIGSFTISMWLKIDTTTTTWQVTLTKGHPSAGNNDGYRIETQTSGQNIYFQIGDGSSYETSNLQSVTFGTWMHIVGRVDRSSNRMYLFKDGVYSGYKDISSIGSLNTPDPLTFSRPNTGLDGVLDEVRISNITRSDDWIATEFENQNNPNSFYSIGKEYSISDHPPNAHYFTHYKEIIIDHTMVNGPHNLLNFSVLISILDSDLQDHVYSSTGNDIAFAYNAAWLDHEIELFNQSYNGTHAQLVTWVRIPRLLTAWDTIIRMYYGNSTMGSQENPEGVWDSNYKAVWHLSEDPTGTIYDSTPNDKDGTSAGSMTSDDQIVGKVNGALDFDGTDDTINLGLWSSSTDFNPSSGTFSFWISRQFLDSELNNQMVLTIRESGTNRIIFRYDGGDYEWRFHHEGQNNQSIVYPSSSDIPRLEWVYVVQTWDVNSDFIKGYINGSLFGSDSGLADPSTGSYDIYLASNRN